MKKIYTLSVYNTLTARYESVCVSEEVYHVYMRTNWNIEDSNKRFYKHEIQFSSLTGGEDGFRGIEWKNIIPFNNRTIARMMTIASGTFTAVDLGDAAIRSGGFNAACILRINFVGVGRFAIALTADAGMGAIKAKRLDERMHIYTQMLALSETKVFYKQEAVWCEAENTYVCLSLLSQSAQNCLQISANLHTQIEETLDDVAPCLRKLADTDSSLASSLLDQLLFE